MKRYLLIFLFFPTLMYGQKVLSLDASEFMHKHDSIIQTKLNTPYPEFTAVTLEGDTITERDLIGKVTFINFWFEGCEPCMAEMDELNALYIKFENDPSFQFISFTKDPADIALEVVRKYSLLFPVCPISDDCYRLNDSDGFPTSLIIDKAGVLKYHKGGMSVEKNKRAEAFREYEELIQDLLVEPEY